MMLKFQRLSPNIEMRITFQSPKEELSAGSARGYHPRTRHVPTPPKCCRVSACVRPFSSGIDFARSLSRIWSSSRRRTREKILYRLFNLRVHGIINNTPDCGEGTVSSLPCWWPRYRSYPGKRGTVHQAWLNFVYVHLGKKDLIRVVPACVIGPWWMPCSLWATLVLHQIPQKI